MIPSTPVGSNWATAMMVLLTQDSMDRLKDIFMQSPIEIAFDSLSVVLAKSLRGNLSWVANENAEYEARFTDFGLVYNETLGYSQLVGTLESYEMEARMESLCPSNLSHVPKMVFTNGGASLSNTNKSFISSVSTTLCMKEDKPFTFTHEILIRR